jgi:hypothetical protein
LWESYNGSVAIPTIAITPQAPVAIATVAIQDAISLELMTEPIMAVAELTMAEVTAV